MTIDTIASWHRIVKSRDTSGLDDLLAEDAVFHSPVVHTPQVGKALTRLYLMGAFHVLFNDTFRYVREIVGEREAALEFMVEIEGISVNGIDLIRWGGDGRRLQSDAAPAQGDQPGPPEDGGDAGSNGGKVRCDDTRNALPLLGELLAALGAGPSFLSITERSGKLVQLKRGNKGG
jgi:SnoaL-like domain